MDKNSLQYSHFERLPVSHPVDRVEFIVGKCRDRKVLDLGCLDETALVKQDTEHWLHNRICEVAEEVVGIDSSQLVPTGGLTTARNGRILRSDATDPDPRLLNGFSPDIIVAGEFIEHIPSPLQFLTNIKRHYPGQLLVMSTPNGCNVSNGLLGLLKREVQHPDHLHNFTFKTLNTICSRANFEHWEIIPYRFFATEMILTNKGLLRTAAIIAEKLIRLLERVFPALSFGYVIIAKV